MNAELGMRNAELIFSWTTFRIRHSAFRIRNSAFAIPHSDFALNSRRILRSGISGFFPEWDC